MRSGLWWLPLYGGCHDIGSRHRWRAANSIRLVGFERRDGIGSSSERPTTAATLSLDYDLSMPHHPPAFW